MLDEVVFTRLLSLAFGVSSYSFALVLVLCLLGLGVGGFAATARAARRPVDLATFGRVQLASAATAMLAMAAIPLVSRALLLARQVPGLGFGPTLALKAALAAALLLPLASVAGLGMPLLLAFVTGRPGGVGTSVGRASLVNTAGTLAGSLATGFVLVTNLGSQASLRLGALASVAAGLLALTAARRRAATGATVAAGALALGVLVVPPWPDWVFLRSDTIRAAPRLRRASSSSSACASRTASACSSPKDATRPSRSSGARACGRSSRTVTRRRPTPGTCPRSSASRSSRSRSTPRPARCSSSASRPA